MASVSRVIAATPEQVFAVLAHGWSYSNWVTGTSHMRAVDANGHNRASSCTMRQGLAGGHP